LPERAWNYGKLVLLFFKLGITYKIYALQNRSFPLFEYFNGKAAPGALPLVAVVFLWHKLNIDSQLSVFLYLLIR